MRLRFNVVGVTCLACALATTSVASAQTTWAQRALLDDEIRSWPNAAAAAAGVGDFERAASLLEDVARSTTPDRAGLAWERAVRLRLAIDDEEHAREDVDLALAGAASTGVGASRAWAAAELLGARCELNAQSARGDEGLVRWRRCEVGYRHARRQVGEATLDVAVRSSVAIARARWAVGEDGGARREAQRALDRWREATRDPTKDPYVAGPDVVEVARERIALELERERLRRERLDLCARQRMERPIRTEGNRAPAWVSRERAREICEARALGRRSFPGGGMSGGNSGLQYLRGWDPERDLGRRIEEGWEDPYAVERAREAVVELRYTLLHRTFALVVAELQPGTSWRADAPIERSPRAPYAYDGFMFASPYEWLALRDVSADLFRAQSYAALHTGSARWYLRTLALAGQLDVEINVAFAQRLCEPDAVPYRDGRPAMHIASTCEDRRFPREPTVLQTCDRLATRAWSLDIAESCRRQRCRFHGVHLGETQAVAEITPSLAHR